MTTIYRDADGDLAAIEGASLALVGYGNQGRSWALNLRDSGLAVRVCARADDSRQQAFEGGDHGALVAVQVAGDLLIGPRRKGKAALILVEQALLEIAKAFSGGRV